MDTRQQVIDQVANKKFGFWKLYKGTGTTIKLAQCDVEENPDADPQKALEMFQTEVANRPVGTYNVTIYRKHKGETGGARYDFTIATETTMQYPQTNNPAFGQPNIYLQAEQNARIIVMLEQVMKQQDLIIEAVKMLYDDDKDNDGAAMKILSLLSGMKSKTAGIAAPAAVAPVASNGFGSYLK